MLEALITSNTKRSLLALFFLSPEKEYYLREMAREIKQQPNLVSSELRKLEQSGLIKSRRKGNAIYYQVNKESPIYSELKSIITKAYAFYGVLKKMLLTYTSMIKFAFIYGSFARGEERQGSDIDLMVIGNPPLERFNHSINRVEKTLGRNINYTLFPIVEFIKKSKSGFIMHIIKEEKIMLIGDENELKSSISNISKISRRFSQ